MNDTTISEDLQWDIERYVLLDETLDRDAFEARMLEDERLALAVAEAVDHMEMLTTACRVSSDSSPPKAWPVFAWSMRIGVGLAVAAGLLIATGLLSPNWSQGDGQAIGETEELSAVAEQWLVMDADGDADESLITPVSWEWEPGLMAEEEDWMLEAAQQFFQELEI